jgi:chromosome segregation ATPase
MVTRNVEVDMKLDDLKSSVDDLYSDQELKQIFIEELESQINRLKEDHQAIRNRLVEKQTDINKTNDKLFQFESFAGAMQRRIDDIEHYRDYKEKKREKLIQKIKMIIQAFLIAISIFTIGYCCGVLQWK